MGKENNPKKIDRRKFLGGMVTVCALPCLGMQSLYAMTNGTKSIMDQDPDQIAENKFDLGFNQKLTFQDIFDLEYGEFIRLAKDLESEIGKEKIIDFLKKRTEKKMFEYGKLQASKTEDHSLSIYVSQFKNANYENLLTKEIVEESETVFELKVTECIWASTFLKQGAGEIGFASICYGDYSWPQGFNPKLKMVRNKTLMQSHDCCNHRYIYKE